MNRYLLHGKPVTREQAVAAWHRSATYANAARKRRGLIFMLADRSAFYTAEVLHLAEAGITIEREPASEHRPALVEG